MQTKVLAIYDLDEDYANHLMEYISNKQGFPFKVIVFTNEEELVKYVAKNHIEILLVLDEAMKEILKGFK